MSTDIELLPLYAELQGHPKLEIVKHYARANVAHATAAKDAEIEALRAEVDQYKRRADAYFQTAERQGKRAERLAEALRDIESVTRDSGGYVYDVARAALRDHDQEVGNG